MTPEEQHFLHIATQGNELYAMLSSQFNPLDTANILCYAMSTLLARTTGPHGEEARVRAIADSVRMGAEMLRGCR